MSSRETALDKCIRGILSMWNASKIFAKEKFGSIAKSFFEVMVTVCFTFIPFFFLSIRWTKAESEINTKGIAETFLSYWQAGEIVLPILGLCGAVTALLALNKGYFSWWVHAIVGVIMLVFVFGGGAALIGSDGFNKDLNTELIDAGFACYGILALVWFLLAIKARLTEPEVRRSDESAQDILSKVNAQRGRARD